ncbi:MAG: COQ9 family protein, partial [Pseudomonadota bacterium]
RDGNWYSKRAILSGVWGATVLYWLGDDSAGYADTHHFINRRIEDVMRFEKIKGQLRDNPLTKPFMQMQEAVMGKITAPTRRDDVPGAQL